MTQRAVAERAVAGLAVAGRGERYLRRVRHQPVEAFGHDRRTRAWRWAAETFDDRWLVAIGLLRLRSRIDAELSGQRLAALARAVGEDVFDAICAYPIAAAHFNAASSAAASIDLASEPMTPESARAIGRATADAAMADLRGDDAQALDVVAAILKGEA